jgi:hypothetical protein
MHGHNRRKPQRCPKLPEVPHHERHVNARPTRQYNISSLTSTSDAALAEAEIQTERIHSVTEPQERASGMDQIAGSEPARWPRLMPRGASHRPDPMSTSLYSTPTASSGAALVGANDREAPHPHSVTTHAQREREAMLQHADEQSPRPSPSAASQRPCRPLLSRARRKLNGASHRSGLLR